MNINALRSLREKKSPADITEFRIFSDICGKLIDHFTMLNGCELALPFSSIIFTRYKPLLIPEMLTGMLKFPVPEIVCSAITWPSIFTTFIVHGETVDFSKRQFTKF